MIGLNLGGNMRKYRLLKCEECKKRRKVSHETLDNDYRYYHFKLCGHVKKCERTLEKGFLTILAGVELLRSRRKRYINPRSYNNSC